MRFEIDGLVIHITPENPHVTREQMEKQVVNVIAQIMAGDYEEIEL